MNSNFIPHFTGHVVAYPLRDECFSMLVKEALVTVTRVNSLRPSDICVSNLTIIGSDNSLLWKSHYLVESHYLNQCWDIVNWTIRNKFQWNFIRNSFIFIQENAFENVVCKTAAILSRPQCVKLVVVHRILHWPARPSIVCCITVMSSWSWTRVMNDLPIKMLRFEFCSD